MEPGSTALDDGTCSPRRRVHLPLPIEEEIHKTQPGEKILLVRPPGSREHVRQRQQQLRDPGRLPDREERASFLPAHTAPPCRGDMEALVEKTPRGLALEREIREAQRELSEARIIRVELQQRQSAPQPGRRGDRRAVGKLLQAGDCSGLVQMAAEDPVQGIGQGARVSPGAAEGSASSGAGCIGATRRRTAAPP